MADEIKNYNEAITSLEYIKKHLKDIGHNSMANEALNVQAWLMKQDWLKQRGVE